MKRKYAMILVLVMMLTSGCSEKKSNVEIEYNDEFIENTEGINEADEQVLNDTLTSEIQLNDQASQESVVVETPPIDINQLTFGETYHVLNSDTTETIDQIKIETTYNSLVLSWEGEKNHTFYKLYASSTEDGKYGLVKNVEPVLKDGTNPECSVKLENFAPHSSVFLKVTSVSVKDEKIEEKGFGNLISYTSKALDQLNNSELTEHLINQFSIISSNDQSVMFRFYDQYKIVENKEAISINSTLKGEYIKIFQDAMNSDYKDEIIESIKAIYVYVYEIRGKKVIGDIEGYLTITVKSKDDITVDLK